MYSAKLNSHDVRMSVMCSAGGVYTYAPTALGNGIASAALPRPVHNYQPQVLGWLWGFIEFRGVQPGPGTVDHLCLGTPASHNNERCRAMRRWPGGALASIVPQYMASRCGTYDLDSMYSGVSRVC